MDSIGCNLLLIRTFALKEEAGPNPGQPERPRRRHVDVGPTLLDHTSLGEALNRPQDASP